jgi:hypothetical protein
MHFSHRIAYLGFLMTTYLPALIWLMSAVVCIFIAKRRHVKPTAAWAILVTLIGPFAIPFVLAAKPEKLEQA